MHRNLFWRNNSSKDMQDYHDYQQNWNDWTGKFGSTCANHAFTSGKRPSMPPMAR